MTQIKRRIAIILAGVSLAGCSSPPASAPLMRSVEQALSQEIDQIAVDQMRFKSWVTSSRDTLRDAYIADLEQRGELDQDWVLEATEVYVLAREQLLQHQNDVERGYRIRQENLAYAMKAQRRALSLIEQQDRLINELSGTDLWRWVYQEQPIGGQR